MFKPSYLVFSGGSVGGIAYTGVIRALEELKLQPINGVSGCSIGSVFALLYSIGYNSKELGTLVSNINFTDLFSINYINFFDNFGCDSGDTIKTALDDLVYAKTNMRHLSFRDHWMMTGTELHVNSSCLEDNVPIYYSHKTSPDVSVTAAVRESISIPFLFRPIVKDNKHYVDGGLHDSLPACVFSPEQTLCFYLVNDSQVTQKNPFLKYCLNLFRVFYFNSEKNKVSHVTNAYKTVRIETGINGFNFKMTDKQKQETMERGFLSVMKFYDHFQTCP